VFSSLKLIFTIINLSLRTDIVDYIYFIFSFIMGTMFYNVIQHHDVYVNTKFRKKNVIKSRLKFRSN
jgi:hypothetical protein